MMRKSLVKKKITKNINKQMQAVILIIFITSELSIYSTKIVYWSGVVLDEHMNLNNTSFHTLGIQTISCHGTSLCGVPWQNM